MRLALGCGLGALVFAVAAAGAQGAVDEPAQDSTTSVSVSQVRIVRLSQIREKVELDRNIGKGFEPTITNMPIVQGARLKTLQGWAEVEFEDNSSARITPDSEMDFSQLGRTSSGSTINRLKLQRGTLYVSLAKTKGNDFVVEVGGERVTLPPESHIRLDVYPSGSELYVFQGKVQVQDEHSTMLVEKGHSLAFNAPGQAEPLLARDRTPGLYDNWDKASTEFHSFRANGVSPYAYGAQDLNYYGAFANVDGCGQVWRPYFTSAAWDPFASGLWANYADAGYSFVSPYPWGWLPYHSGAWLNCGGQWGWQPGGDWAGLRNPKILNPIKGPGGIHPIHPPTGVVSLVVVGGGRIPVSHQVGDKFQFRQDSAGMGVPRASFAKLGKISAEVASRGSFVQSLPEGGMRNAPPITASGGGGIRPAATGGGAQSRPVVARGSESGGGGAHSWGGSGGGVSSSSGGTHVSSSSASTASSSSSSSSSGTASGGSHK